MGEEKPQGNHVLSSTHSSGKMQKLRVSTEAEKEGPQGSASSDRLLEVAFVHS